MNTTSQPPLGATSYRLENCQLRLLDHPLVEPIATELALLDPWRTLGYSATGLQKYLNSPDSQLKRYVIMQTDAIAGIVCVRYPWLRGIYLELIGIFPNAQQQGIGATVMQWLTEQVEGQVNNNVWALVSEFNTNAQIFYERCGFSRIGLLNNLVKDGFNEILLRKIAWQPR